MGARPLLLWFGLDGERKGVLHATGEVVHREVVREMDALSFACWEQPEKYDRVLWRDPDDGVWREHYVREVHALDDGTFALSCEGALFETRADFLEGFRLESAGYYKVLERLVPHTRFTAGTAGWGGVSEVTAWITRKTVLEGIRKLEQLYSVEFYLDIVVDEERGGVVGRRLCFCAEQGAWRGLRLTRGKNLAGGSVTIRADEVVTALFGYGSSFGAYDEEGNATGGFTRRLTFGSVNGGRDFVEDARARERWGRVGPDGRRMNNFSHVIFDSVEEPMELYRKTHGRLQELTSPRVTFALEGEMEVPGRYVGLGDTVLVCDEAGGAPCRVAMRAVGRTRVFGEALSRRIRLGDVTAGARSAWAAYERRCGKVAGFGDALAAAGLAEAGDEPAAEGALSVELAFRGARRADGEAIDTGWWFEVREGDVYRYDAVVRSPLAFAIGGVRVAMAAAGIDEGGLYLAAGGEKLYAVEVSPAAADVAAGAFSCAVEASCPGGNAGLPSEYAACSVYAAHRLPGTDAVRPVSYVPDDLEGDGTFERPYTAADLRRCVCVSAEESAIEDAWVSGYIVGWAAMGPTDGLTAAVRLGAEGARASNVVLADAPGETDAARMVGANLSTATRRRRAVRAALNLADNPDMVGVRVWVLGDVARYGRESGLRRVDEYRFCDASGQWHGWNTYNGELL